VTYLKSALVALFSLIAGGILLLLIMLASLTPWMRTGATVGLDVVSVARSSPLIWAFVVLVFSLGFHWEFRRLRLRQAK